MPVATHLQKHLQFIDRSGSVGRDQNLRKIAVDIGRQRTERYGVLRAVVETKESALLQIVLEVGMSVDKNPPSRPDAKYNRNHLLEVARDLLTASPAASLNSIAKAAQVGPGTLYRHFANREMLVLAVEMMEIQQLVDAAPALLEHNPPLKALQMWFERFARDLRIRQGLREALYRGANDSITRENFAPVILAIDVLLHACQSRGLIRSDISAEDLLLLVGFMLRADAGPDGQARVARLLRLTIDGLKVHGGKR